MNKLHRKPYTKAECKERLKKWDDPFWRKQAIEGTAELIYYELFPADNEPRVRESADAYRKGGAE